MARNLTISSPLMTGDDVKAAQTALHITADGQYGPVTGAAVKRWKFTFGFRAAQVTTSLTTGEAPYLFGQKKAGPLMLANRKLRAAKAARAAAAQTVPAKAVDIALADAAKGFKENPANSNKVPELAELARILGLSAWFQAMGWPWCDYYQALCSQRAGGTMASKAGFAGKFNVLYCPALLAAARAAQFGLSVVPHADARKGDLVLFDWDKDGIADHVGRMVQNLGAPGLITVEGNTSMDNNGSQSNGGCVARRSRDWSQVIAIVREEA